MSAGIGGKGVSPERYAPGPEGAPDVRVLLYQPTEMPHRTAGLLWLHGGGRFGWSALLGQEPGSEGIPSYAAAARAETLKGLPAAFIAVGALDLFLEEDVQYARRLIRAGVPTELHVYPGVYHGFQMVPSARVTQTLARDLVSALRRALRL